MENQEPRVITPARLMRFSFEPNENLQQKLGLFVNEKHLGSKPLRFYASRQLLLKSSDYRAYEGDLQELVKNFKGFHDPLYLEPSLGSIAIDDHTTRFGFKTTEQSTFDEVTSLSIKPNKNYDLIHHYLDYSGKEFPNMIKDKPDQVQYLYVDIATNSLIPIERRQEAGRAFVDAATRHELFLHTEALIGVRDFHIGLPPPSII